MEQIRGWLKDLKADLQVTEDSPIGQLKVTIVCKASEDNMLALTRISGRTVIIEPEQPDLVSRDDGTA